MGRRIQFTVVLPPSATTSTRPFQMHASVLLFSLVAMLPQEQAYLSEIQTLARPMEIEAVELVGFYGR